MYNSKYPIVCPLPEDYGQLGELWEQSVRATHHFLDEEYICFLKPLIRNKYLYAVELFGVRTDEGGWAGFMGISGKKIEMLFLSPSSRGEGIGKRLVDYAVKELGIDSVDVNEQNEQAVGFYFHLGFRTVQRDLEDSMGKPYPILHLKLNNLE